MNTLDTVILVVLALAAIYGFLRGVLRMVTSIIALAGGIYFASIYYPQVAAFFQPRFDLGPSSAAAIGYVVVFAAVFVVVAVVGEAFGRLLNIARLGWIDRLCGAAVGVAVAGALMGVLLMIFTTLLPMDAPILRQSELTPILLRYAETLRSYVPDEIMETYRVKRNELWRLWLQGEPSASPTPASK
jgi:membrane protein required for colicin V production